MKTQIERNVLIISLCKLLNRELKLAKIQGLNLIDEIQETRGRKINPNSVHQRMLKTRQSIIDAGG
jgi:hypothetical protein